MRVEVIKEPYEYGTPFYKSVSEQFEVLIDGTPFYLVRPLGQPDGPLVLTDEDGYVLGVFRDLDEAEREIPKVFSKL